MKEFFASLFTTWFYKILVAKHSDFWYSVSRTPVNILFSLSSKLIFCGLFAALFDFPVIVWASFNFVLLLSTAADQLNFFWDFGELILFVPDYKNPRGHMN